MPRFEANANWHGWDASKAALKRKGRIYLALAALNAAVSILCGVCATGVTRDNWVGFAATAALAALMVEIIGVVRFYLAKAGLPAQEFRGIHRMVMWGTLYHILLMLVAAIAGLIACIRNFSGPLDLLVIAGMFVTLLCSLGIRSSYKRIPKFEMKDPDA